MKIQLTTREVENTLKDLIEEHISLLKEINETSAYTESECKHRLALMKRCEILDEILRKFDLQTFQYCRENFTGIEII